MTVEELRQRLSAYPSDLEVEIGYDSNLGTTWPVMVELRHELRDPSGAVGDAPLYASRVRIVCP